VIDEIDWENRISEGRVVTISNLGDNNLRVLDVALTSNGGGALYLEEVGELNLAPGASVEFSVLATLSTFEVVESALRIQSGDVDESSLAIPIVAIPAGYEYAPGDTGGSGDTGS